MSIVDSLIAIIKSVHSDFTTPPDMHPDANPDIRLSSESNDKPVVMTKETVDVYVGNPEGKRIANLIEAHAEELMLPGERAIEVGFRDSINIARSLPSDPTEKKKYHDLLERFKKFAPQKDWPIIEDALYVRRLFEAGHNVAWYAEAIAVEYLSRGSNICKLISSKYFEDYLEPMYKNMGAGDPYRSGFAEFYEEAVTQYPFAVFVSKRRTVDDVKTEVIRKIAQNLGDGGSDVHILNIHGIGRPNGTTIVKVLHNPEVKKFYTSDPDILELDGATYARIYF